MKRPTTTLPMQKLLHGSSLTATSLLALTGTAYASRPSYDLRQIQAQPALRGSVSDARAAVVSLSTTRLEVAPAGTYDRMKQAIAMYQAFVVHTPIGDAPVQKASWVISIEKELRSLAQEATSEGIPQPSPSVISSSAWVLNQCASLGVSEPSLSNDEKAGIEIYVKEGKNAVLFTLHADQSLAIYWDSPHDQWRSKFNTGGRAWKEQVKRVISDLVTV